MCIRDSTNTETGEQVIKTLDLIKYLNMLKQEHYKDMDLQEYLDREDRYSMIFFVDENLTLIRSCLLYTSLFTLKFSTL